VHSRSGIQRDVDGEPEPAAGHRAGIGVASSRGGAFHQARQTAAAPIARRAAPASIINNLSRRAPCVPGQPNGAQAGAAVADHVRDAFAHRPAEKSIDDRGQRGG